MKHLANVARLGAEDAYGLAVAEGEIDGEMQKFFANEACLEFAAFEFFFQWQIQLFEVRCVPLAEAELWRQGLLGRPGER